MLFVFQWHVSLLSFIFADVAKVHADAVVDAAGDRCASCSTVGQFCDAHPCVMFATDISKSCGICMVGAVAPVCGHFNPVKALTFVTSRAHVAWLRYSRRCMDPPFLARTHYCHLLSCVMIWCVLFCGTVMVRFFLRSLNAT